MIRSCHHLHSILLVCIWLMNNSFAGSAPPTTKSTERGVKIINESGSKVEVYWIHPQTREGSLMSDPNIQNGGDFSLNSFVGHEFQIRELPSAKTGVCSSDDRTCRTGLFAVSKNDEQRVTVKEGIKIEFVDDQIRANMEAKDIIGNCRTKVYSRFSNEKALDVSHVETLLECVQVEVTQTLAKANKEINFQAKVREGMAQLMENYTCADFDLETSGSLREETWRGARDRRRRQVQVLFDRPASKIMLVSNFVSQNECVAMENVAQKKLHRASVADGKGGSHFSEHRKAMQAGIKVPWEKENEGNHIAALSRRVYDFTNHVLDLNIDEHGQEELMSIQYSGRGIEDTEPDRYTPHCDGDCTGLPHKNGTRMATMVMYCTIPESGGHTNFRNAGVHVQPEAGSAIFFSYIDPDKRVTDTGFTEHSGCPVIEGEKKIVTQWIRLGVDKETPWNAFDTLGLLRNDKDD